MKVLLVEDNEDHATLVQAAMSRSSAPSEVTHAVDCESAVAIMESEASHGEAYIPDIIMLDLKLPGIGGIDFLKRVRTHSAWRHVPVIVLTSSSALGDRVAAYDSCVNSYVVKPQSFRDLQSVVEDLHHYWGDVNCPPN